MTERMCDSQDSFAQQVSDQSPLSEDDVSSSGRSWRRRNKVIILILVSILALGCLLLTGVIWWTASQTGKYPTNEEILQSLEEISSSLSESEVNCSLVTIGHSVELRPIKLLRISPGRSRVSEAPLVWVVCGVHAREWTSPLACLQIIKHIRDILLSRAVTSEDDLLKRLRYNFVVITNPDGYIYSMSDPSRRLTWKNRATIGCPDSERDGVDLNRNFGTGFNHGDDCYGAPDCPYESSPCSITYGGSAPFSELESRAVREAMMLEVPWLSISMHGNANMWAAPYSSKVMSAPGVDMAELELLTERIQAKFGSVYHAGCSSCVLYRGGGTLSDWVYEELGVNRWEDVTSLVFLSSSSGPTFTS